ncbi:MAG: SDR family oxidoreductase [Deltaproteobacteria bacterium]|nr:SDR family oxidoreductase [Deltaproteobacteria bacterium]
MSTVEAESPAELFSLAGRVALVTGASSGLGTEFADALASAGASLLLVARRKQQLDEQAEQLRQRWGATVTTHALDITEREAVAAAWPELSAEAGGVDILVNNAGISVTGRAETQWPGAWDDSLAVNLTAAFQLSLLAAEGMRASGRGGRIINVSSIFGSLGSSLFRLAAYSASKGGLTNLTRQLAVEWAGDGITVNAIAPAWFPSEMTGGSTAKESVVDRMSRGCPMNRMGRAGELRTACLFLASPASSYVTGSVIPVDGGYAAW